MWLRKIIPIIFYLLLAVIICFPGCGDGCRGCGKQPIQTIDQGSGVMETKGEDKANLNAPPPSIPLVDIPLNDPKGKVSMARNSYFIFDSSGSMDDSYAGDAGERKIDGAKKAVAQFIKKVPANVNLGLYIYDSLEGREVLKLEPKNHAAFMAEINKLVPGNGTPLGIAVRFATDQLVKQYKKQLGYGEFRLIIVTDGLANNNQEELDFLASYKYATSCRVPMYVIGLDLIGSNPLRDYAVSYREANSSKDLEKALEETLAESQYFDPTEFKK